MELRDVLTVHTTFLWLRQKYASDKDTWEAVRHLVSERLLVPSESIGEALALCDALEVQRESQWARLQQLEM